MSVWKVCKCRERVLDEAGNPVLDDRGKPKLRELGHKCPELRQANGAYNPNHGAWYARIEAEPETVLDKKTGRAVLDEQGRPKTRRRTVKKGGFTTKRDAQKWIDEQREKAGRGVDVARRVTVAEYLAEWIKAKNDIRGATRASYGGHIDSLWIPKIGRHELGALRKSHVQAALDDLDVGGASKQRYRATLRAALNDAVREGLITVNPAALVKIQNGKRPKALVWTDARAVEFWADYETRLAAARKRAVNASAFKVWRDTKARPSPVMVWTPQQLGRFLDQAADHPWYPLYHLIGFRGLRRGEAVGLRRQDLDLDAGSLYVAWTVTLERGKPVAGQPKTEGSAATVTLDKTTVQVLRDHVDAQAEQRAKVGSGWAETPYVFTRDDGSMLNPEHVSDTFEQLAFEAGCPPIRLHDLRHTAASVMHLAGLDIKTISNTLRHSTIGMTADTYTSTFDDADRAAAEASAAVVPRAPRETSGPPSVPQGSISSSKND